MYRSNIPLFLLYTSTALHSWENCSSNINSLLPIPIFSNHSRRNKMLMDLGFNAQLIKYYLCLLQTQKEEFLENYLPKLWELLTKEEQQMIAFNGVEAGDNPPVGKPLASPRGELKKQRRIARSKSPFDQIAIKNKFDTALNQNLTGEPLLTHQEDQEVEPLYLSILNTLNDNIHTLDLNINEIKKAIHSLHDNKITQNMSGNEYHLRDRVLKDMKEGLEVIQKTSENITNRNQISKEQHASALDCIISTIKQYMIIEKQIKNKKEFDNLRKIMNQINDNNRKIMTELNMIKNDIRDLKVSTSPNKTPNSLSINYKKETPPHSFNHLHYGEHR
ncbi:putative signal peptide protein [Puccinia sorghi]|uniref:Putative signal peptide protein n=1 Tax=Puccinia sorghi TaxID=27349 RepID=A0A0L6VL78_9BASI|nr:putative signal peptide protein [Puccinia sorghi]